MIEPGSAEIKKEQTFLKKLVWLMLYFGHYHFQDDTGQWALLDCHWEVSLCLKREVVGLEIPSSPLLVLSEDEARPLLVTKQLVKFDLESIGSLQWICGGKIVSLWAPNYLQSGFELVSFHLRVIEITLSAQLCDDNLDVHWPSFQHLPWGAIAGRSPTLATWPTSEEWCVSHPLWYVTHSLLTLRRIVHS